MIDFACKKVSIQDILKCSFSLTKTEVLILLDILGFDENFYFSSSFLADKLGYDITTIQKALKKFHNLGILKKVQRNFQNGGFYYDYFLNDKNEIKLLIGEKINSWISSVNSELDKFFN